MHNADDLVTERVLVALPARPRLASASATRLVIGRGGCGLRLLVEPLREVQPPLGEAHDAESVEAVH
jgi:hypothetical protein